VNQPLGYLLEAESLWWGIWCTSADFRYGMTMARHREKQAADQAYVNLATKASVLADAQLKQHETGEMHLYAAMAIRCRRASKSAAGRIVHGAGRSTCAGTL